MKTVVTARPIVAGDIMTREVKTLHGAATLQEVAEMMTEHDISGVPIVSATGELRGLICESDLVNEARRKNAIPRLALFGLYAIPDEQILEAFRDGWSLCAEEFMKRKLVTAREDTPLAQLSEAMVKHDINRIPIVDEDNRLLGIVTREDVLRGVVSRLRIQKSTFECYA